MMPMLEPHGKVISIGTRWHENDIHSYLQKIADYTCRIYKAVLKYPEENNGKAEVLWEERFPYEELMKIKERYGSLAFEMQYQNNIVSIEDSPIKREWVEYSVENYKMIPTPFETYMGVDLASKGEETDYFTITIVGVSEGKLYVLDGLRTKASLFRQFELIKSYDTKWQPVRIGIEQAAQQKMIVDQLVESTTLPIIPIKSSIVNDRMSRVQRISVLF
jgi:phage terminase large subunit-like protein